MDLKQLEYIVMIAEENSITRAAERLFITQSGLNQQLLKLEAELGIQLFHRSKNDFRLTQAGQVYVSYARKILRLKQEAYNILNDMEDTDPKSNASAPAAVQYVVLFFLLEVLP